jgi:hypothetical protein
MDMYALSFWAILAVLSAVVYIAVVCVVRKPMADLLKVNSYIAPAANFYLRSFYLIVLLAVLAVLAEAQGPSAEQLQDLMRCVWWVASSLSSVFWAVLLSIGSFVALVTILFAVLGRYRD